MNARELYEQKIEKLKKEIDRSKNDIIKLKESFFNYKEGTLVSVITNQLKCTGVFITETKHFIQIEIKGQKTFFRKDAIISIKETYGKEDYHNDGYVDV